VSRIHPFAIVSPDAEIGQDVRVGAFSVIDAGVSIGDRCTIGDRVSIKSGTTLGTDNEISEGVVLGGKPQHLRAGEQLGDLQIGNGNILREFVTIHRGLAPGKTTVVGNKNLFMVNAHVAHDCQIGNQTILANNVMLAGHVRVADRAYLSGAVGVHQFCRIGSYAMVGGQAHISQDVPPFVTVDGQSSLIVGLNTIGLRRAGFSDHEMRQLKDAYRIIYRSGSTWNDILEQLSERFRTGPASQLLPFLAEGKRGFTQERRGPRLTTLSVVRQESASDESEENNLRRAG
jgi:UDP-N-acetylglucosamine acyltransferase